MSYSSLKKEQLSAQVLKKNCCRTAFLYGLLYPFNSFDTKETFFSTDSKNEKETFSMLVKQCFKKNAYFTSPEDKHDEGSYVFMRLEDDEGNVCDGNILKDAFYSIDLPNTDLFVCESCKYNFLKGVFIACGTITDPQKGLHLELLFKNDESGAGLKNYLEESGLEPKEIKRRGNYALYFKKHEEIEDFLALIGDSQGAMEIINLSIMKSLRNDANRYSNCDAANLYKATGAAQTQIQAINKLVESGLIDELSEDLKITAHLRIEHPEMPLSELASFHNPPISKSGVNHRLQKIMKAASKL